LHTYSPQKEKLKSFFTKAATLLIVPLILITEALEEPSNWSSFWVVLIYTSYFLWLSANEIFSWSDKIKRALINN